MQLQLSPRHIWPWYKWAASSAPKRPVTRSTKPAAEQRQLLHARHHRQEEEEDEHQNQQQFEPWKPPPFKIGDVRAAIPSHCWEKNVWLSMSYVLRDAVAVAVAVALLALAAGHLDSWFFWPLYWLAQGTLFWAIFVLGHDCGHGSFSNSVWLNNLVGHLLHSCILVPYHGWRISHRTHHQNHGNVDKDESWHPEKNRVLYVARDGMEEKAMKKILTAMFDKWVPQLTSILIGCQPSSLMTLLTEKTYREMDATSRKLRFRFPFPLFAFPAYLWRRSPGKEGSHFHPGSSLFRGNERKDVVVSTLCWSAMVALLLSLAGVYGPVPFLKLYGVPYLVFVLWLDLVTYLHHHGHGQKLPWYRGKEWSYLRGGLTTVDRDYGWINNIHHDIGTHVIHHLFPQIPHYNLVEATRAAKPVLGEYYREPEKSGPLPAHLFGVLLRSLRVDHFVSDEGDVVFYQTDPQLHKELLRQKAC